MGSRRGFTDPSASHERDADDADLMARVQQGDAPAFDQLLAAYWQLARSYAERLLGDRESARDIAQETFVRLWQRRAAWRPYGQIRVWILRTVRNLCFTEHRRSMVRARWMTSREALHTSHNPEPAAEAEAAELSAAMSRAIESLSPRRREVFTLFHLEDLSYREISDILGIRPQTVANYLQAALADLRVALRPFFPVLTRPRVEKRSDPTASAG